MRKNYEPELPAGYKAVKIVDAAAKQFTIIANIAATLITVAGAGIAIAVFRPFSGTGYEWQILFVFIGVMFTYLVLHELVHGAAYWLTTGQKLTFGFTASVAYCGVPNIYVYRRASMIALLAPFVLFNVLFLLGAFLLPTESGRFYSAMMLAIHVGGCVGDLYDTILYLFVFRDDTTLMRDTGPKQTFYRKENDE